MPTLKILYANPLVMPPYSEYEPHYESVGNVTDAYAKWRRDELDDRSRYNNALPESPLQKDIEKFAAAGTQSPCLLLLLTISTFVAVVLGMAC